MQPASILGLPAVDKITLGLSVMRVLAIPGECYTQEEIAAFSGCSTMTIYKIEHRALRKMRRAFERLRLRVEMRGHL